MVENEEVRDIVAFVDRKAHPRFLDKRRNLDVELLRMVDRMRNGTAQCCRYGLPQQLGVFDRRGRYTRCAVVVTVEVAQVDDIVGDDVHNAR